MKEREIVCLINDALKDALTALNHKSFYNIVLERERSDGIKELIDVEKGKADKKVFPDDHIQFMCYHKYAGSNYEEKRGYGASQATYIQKADMSMVIIAKRTADITDDVIESWVANTIGITLTQSELVTFKLISCSILPTSSTIDAGILVREFPEIKRNTFPNILCLELKYSITTKYNAGCADLCFTNNLN